MDSGGEARHCRAFLSGILWICAATHQRLPAEAFRAVWLLGYLSSGQRILELDMGLLGVRGAGVT